MADMLDRVLREIRERKEQARAAVEETRRLEAALAALTPARVELARARRAAGSRRRAAARGRAPRGVTRAAVLAVVSERPGVSAAELAAATGIARATITSMPSRLGADRVLERVELPAGTHGYRLAEAAGNDGAVQEHVDDEGSRAPGCRRQARRGRASVARVGRRLRGQEPVSSRLA